MNAAAKNEAAREPRTRKQAPVVGPEDKALAERLLATPTIADKSWAHARGATRNAGEGRAAFIRRVLLGEAS